MNAKNSETVLMCVWGRAVVRLGQHYRPSWYPSKALNPGVSSSKDRAFNDFLCSLKTRVLFLTFLELCLLQGKIHTSHY